ncbi:hypothetical protein [Cytobacillus praedii]|nr:hypothetical protein [Cytobacillus praedii]
MSGTGLSNPLVDALEKTLLALNEINNLWKQNEYFIQERFSSFHTI